MVLLLNDSSCQSRLIMDTVSNKSADPNPKIPSMTLLLALHKVDSSSLSRRGFRPCCAVCGSQGARAVGAHSLRARQPRAAKV